MRMDNGKPREGQLCRLVIDGYASDGAGVARLDGMVVFVQGGIRGEACDVRLTHVGRQSGPLRPLRRKDSPHRRPPSLPSKRREPISKGNPPLPLNRPPKLGRWLCGNRAGSRPGIGHRSDTGQNPYPCPGAAAVLLRPRMLAGKLGGAATLHRAHPTHQERLRVGYLKDIPFQERACPYQREIHALRAAR